MERRIYKVAFEVKTSEDEDWFPHAYNVLANGDALRAVHKAERWARKEFAKPYRDSESGEMITPKVRDWRLRAVKVVAEADVT